MPWALEDTSAREILPSRSYGLSSLGLAATHFSQREQAAITCKNLIGTHYALDGAHVETIAHLEDKVSAPLQDLILENRLEVFRENTIYI